MTTGRALERLTLGILAGLLVVALAPSAFAAKPRVGVGLTGASARAVREAIASTLRHHGYELVEIDGGDGSDDAAVAAVKRARLPAVILGEVRDGKRLKLRVYGASGDVIGAATWAEKGAANKLAPLVGRTLWARIGDALAKATGASSAEVNDDGDSSGEAPAKDAQAAKASKGADEPEGDAAGEAPRKRRHVERETSANAAPSSTAPALDLSAGLRLVSRTLTWAPSGTALRNFSLSNRMALGLAAAWYPAAPYRAGWLSNLGVGAAVEWLPGLDSSTVAGASYATTALDVEGDVRYRLLLGGAGQLAFAVGGGQQSFVFRSQGTAQRNDIQNLPDVQYTYLRVGADARFTLPANLSILVSGGYRFVLGAGSQNYLIQESSYLPGSTVVAFDVAAGLGYRFLSALEARAGFDLRRYQLSTSGANAAMVTSATDQYTAFWLSLAVLLGDTTTTEGPARPNTENTENAE